MKTASLADLRPLIQYSARRLANRSAGRLNADDLTQVGMMAAHTTLLQAGTAEEDRVRFARQSAKLAMIDLARVESRQVQDGEGERLLIGGDVDGIADPAPGPDAIVLRRQMARLVVEAITQLPRRLRDVLRLTYESEMTQRELAAVWGMDPARINQLHQEALEQLRRLLGVHEPSLPPPRSSTNAEMFAADIVRGADARLLREPGPHG